MTDEQLFDLVKSHFTNEHLKEVHFNLTNESIKLVIIRPPQVEHIKIDFVVEYKEND